MGESSVPDIEKHTLKKKTKAIISDATDFRDERTNNLTNDKNKKLEDALILMVRQYVYSC